jgi:hypothetical protein
MPTPATLSTSSLVESIATTAVAYIAGSGTTRTKLPSWRACEVRTIPPDRLPLDDADAARYRISHDAASSPDCEAPAAVDEPALCVWVIQLGRTPRMVAA